MPTDAERRGLFDHRQAPALPSPDTRSRTVRRGRALHARRPPPKRTSRPPQHRLATFQEWQSRGPPPRPLFARTPALPANGCGAGGHRRLPAPLPSPGHPRPRPPGQYRAPTPAERGPRNPAWGQRGPRPRSPVRATTARPATLQDAPRDSQRKPSFHAHAAFGRAQFSDALRCARRESLSRTEQRGDGHLRRQGPGRPSRRRGPAEWRSRRRRDARKSNDGRACCRA